MRLTTHTDTLITFEYPVNEATRVCLKLDQLFTDFKKYMNEPSADYSHNAAQCLLKIMDVVDRPDIKSKLTQTLNQYASTLGQLEQFPQVDPKRLAVILEQLDTHIHNMHNNHLRIAESLSRNEFLNQLRLQLANPGGICHYKAPAYNLWLQQSADHRLNDLKTWFSTFNEINSITSLLLSLVRNSTGTQTMTANNGFYQQALNANLPCELIQIGLPLEFNLYPEICVGRHRLTIRFVTPCYHNNGHPEQSKETFEFSLNCCRL